MKKYFIGLIFSLFASIGTMNAQSNYETAIGLRAGVPYGFTAVHFLNEHNALEGIVHHFQDHLGLTALFEHHTLFFGRHDFNFYYGGGLGVALATNKEANSSIGIDGIIGLEYTFPKHPFNLSLDAKPYLNFLNEVKIRPSGALSFRYTFRSNTKYTK